MRVSLTGPQCSARQPRLHHEQLDGQARGRHRTRTPPAIEWLFCTHVFTAAQQLIKEFEASHGTVTDLYEKMQRGEETSLNPLGLGR